MLDIEIAVAKLRITKPQEMTKAVGPIGMQWIYRNIRKI
jgi:hypothetical protein